MLNRLTLRSLLSGTQNLSGSTHLSAAPRIISACAPHASNSSTSSGHPAAYSPEIMQAPAAFRIDCLVVHSLVCTFVCGVDGWCRATRAFTLYVYMPLGLGESNHCTCELRFFSKCDGRLLIRPKYHFEKAKEPTHSRTR